MSRASTLTPGGRRPSPTRSRQAAARRSPSPRPHGPRRRHERRQPGTGGAMAVVACVDALFAASNHVDLRGLRRHPAATCRSFATPTYVRAARSAASYKKYGLASMISKRCREVDLRARASCARRKAHPSRSRAVAHHSRSGRDGPRQRSRRECRVCALRSRVVRALRYSPAAEARWQHPMAALLTGRCGADVSRR